MTPNHGSIYWIEIRWQPQVGKRTRVTRQRIVTRELPISSSYQKGTKRKVIGNHSMHRENIDLETKRSWKKSVDYKKMKKNTNQWRMWFCDPLVFHRQHRFWPSLQVTEAKILRSQQLLEFEESYYHSTSKNTIEKKVSKNDIWICSYKTYFASKHEHFTSHTRYSIECRVTSVRYHVRSWSGNRRFHRAMTGDNSCRRCWRLSCCRN